MKLVEIMPKRVGKNWKTMCDNVDYTLLFHINRIIWVDLGTMIELPVRGNITDGILNEDG